MMSALTLLENKDTSRNLYLYDTFEGMTKPGDQDGEAEKKEWQEKSTGIDSSTWCYAGEDEVKQYVLSTGYPSDQFNFIKGKVEDTIPDSMPDQIALLRLDTDWYASTKHELIHLYPILQSGGVLIIDDYGAWKGARHATDEYFENKVLLQRIDWTGTACKPATDIFILRSLFAIRELMAVISAAVSSGGTNKPVVSC